MTLYRSHDEGRPEGTERLIWSKDGTKLLLVGRHFFVKEDLFLDNGDQLYFLYDSGRPATPGATPADSGGVVPSRSMAEHKWSGGSSPPSRSSWKEK